MIVTVVSDVLGEPNNGTTIAAYNLIQSLRKRGHTVRIVCSDQEHKGEPDYYVVPKMDLGPIINAAVARNHVSLSKPDVKVINEALDGTDLVHVMFPFPLGINAAKLAHKRNIPLTAGFHMQAENLTAHIALMDLGFANTLVYLAAWRQMYRYCSCIHYPTEFIRKTFEHAIHKKTPAYVISNGVHRDFRRTTVERPERYRDKFVIHTTGRLSKEKTQYVLIDAIDKSKYRDRIQLVLAGKGPLYEKLNTRAQKLPNKPEFVFLSRQDLVRQLNMSDLYVHPAEIEIEAIACLEAIACGLVPVIANSKRSATRFFAMDERNLFRNKNSTDLARRIDYWIEHPRELEAMRRLYSGFSSQHEFEHCMDEMENMMKEAIEKHHEAT